MDTGPGFFTGLQPPGRRHCSPSDAGAASSIFAGKRILSSTALVAPDICRDRFAGSIGLADPNNGGGAHPETQFEEEEDGWLTYGDRAMWRRLSNHQTTI